jgi:superfamily II DNA or RNA helicase
MTLQQSTTNLTNVKYKAVLSNRIYLTAPPEQFEQFKKKLTYKVPSKIFGKPPETKYTIKRAGPGVASLPIGRLDLIPENYEIIDKRICIPAEFPEFKYDLRPNQQFIYDQVKDNCLINANVSWGKTFTAIAIATKLKQKTLIIVHTLFLLEQWKEEIEKCLGITPNLITGGNADAGTSPVTVANIQTLRKHALALKDSFGLVIVDEVHHAPAKEFELTLNTFRARYKIGLSATLKRKDFLHVVLPDYFGKTVYKPPSENLVQPEILMINSGISFSSNMTIPWATKVNELIYRPEYQQLLFDLSNAYAKAGHKVLVVSDRTDLITTLHERIPEESIQVIGTTQNRERLRDYMETSNKINICFGALSIFKEGVSWNFLSALILGAPINNNPMLKQLIGRIQRIYPGKLQPIVADIVLKGSTAKRQAQARAAYYMEEGYRISWVDIT